MLTSNKTFKNLFSLVVYFRQSSFHCLHHLFVNKVLWYPHSDYNHEHYRLVNFHGIKGELSNKIIFSLKFFIFSISSFTRPLDDCKINTNSMINNDKDQKVPPQAIFNLLNILPNNPIFKVLFIHLLVLPNMYDQCNPS